MNRNELMASAVQYANGGLLKQPVEMGAKEFVNLRGMPEYLAAFELAMKGKLAEESARLEQLIADWDARQNFAEETKKLEAEKTALARDKEYEKQKAESRWVVVEDGEKRLAEAQKKLALDQETLRQRENACTGKIAENEAKHSLSMNSLRDKHEEADKKLAGIAHTQQVLYERGLALDAREAKVRDAMKRVSELVK